MSTQRDARVASVSVENVGGIDATDLTFHAGVTVLSGENATNRTSLLTAIAGALGGSCPNLKSDAEAGAVELEFGGETYTRTYARRDGTVVAGGEPFTDEAALVDLFVCLVEDNPIRRAVERGDDLRELVMRPVDTDAIEENLREKRAERDRLRERIHELDAMTERVPELEERKAEISAELEAVESRLDELCLEDAEEDSAAIEAVEARIRELERLQDDLRDARERRDTESSSLEAVRREREELLAERGTLDGREEELAAIEDELETLRRRERELADSINDLSAINQFNRDLLDGDEAASWMDPDASPADRLQPETSVVDCWTCGSPVERRAIRDRLDELEAVTAERRNQRSDVRDRIDTLRERREELRAVEDRRGSIASRLDDIEGEIERRRRRIDDLGATIDELSAEIVEVKESVGEDEGLGEDHREVYRQLSDLEFERGQLENERCEVGRELESLRESSEEREQLSAQLEAVEAEIDCLRTHVEETEKSAVEGFNEHVAEVLSLLEYGNISRVWIERKAGPGGADGASSFDLHVVRQAADGGMYEDTVSNLSESEREVVGLVVGLAGYLAHDVAECVPMMLLDSLEAIDGERIAALLEYFAAHVPYLVVALLPDDARAVECDHEEIPASAL